MRSPTIQFQAAAHPLVTTTSFNTFEEYCLYLIHAKAYHEAQQFARENVVLDLGCNVGYGTSVLGTHAALAVGVDVSRHALREASERPRTANVQFVPVDGVNLPFAQHQFQLITSFQVIEHVQDYDTYLVEIKRVLTPGGVVAFSTPNAAIRLDPGMAPWNEFHVHEWTAPELTTLLQQHFGQVHVRGLFAEDQLYATEFNRVQRAREAARIAAQRRSTWQWALRTRVKALVPTRLLTLAKAARSQRTQAAHVATLSPAVLEQYSVDDLFYDNQNLDRALDLLAVCSHAL